jgi:hypothetical protein
MGDLNGDGAVNRADAAILARNFGRASAIVPSPSPAAAIIASNREEETDRLVARRRRVVEPHITAIDSALSEIAIDSAQLRPTRRIARIKP